jgi:hypothetical protein
MKPLQKAFHAGTNGNVLQTAGLPDEFKKQGNILGLGFDDGYVGRWRGRRFGCLFFATCEQQERQAGNQTNGFKSHGAFSAGLRVERV